MSVKDRLLSTLYKIQIETEGLPESRIKPINVGRAKKQSRHDGLALVGEFLYCAIWNKRFNMCTLITEAGPRYQLGFGRTRDLCRCKGPAIHQQNLYCNVIKPLALKLTIWSKLMPD